MTGHPNCDGCAQELPLGTAHNQNPNHHYLPDGRPFMACTADRYKAHTFADLLVYYDIRDVETYDVLDDLPEPHRLPAGWTLQALVNNPAFCQVEFRLEHLPTTIECEAVGNLIQVVEAQIRQRRSDEALNDLLDTQIQDLTGLPPRKRDYTTGEPIE